MTASEAIHLSVFCSAFGALTTALEGLFLWQQGAYSANGVWPWRLLKLTFKGKFWEELQDQSVNSATTVLLFASVSVALAIIANFFMRFSFAPFLLVAIIIHIMLHARVRWGGEGGDQMMLIVFVTGLVAALFPDSEHIQIASALFIAGQITLSYISSGTAKCFGPLWRSGDALGKIMNHYTYGWQPFGRFLARNPVIGKYMCHAVMAFQLTFPLYFILPMPYAIFYLLGGVVFHFSIALIMRLNLFVSVFLGTYFCLFFSHPIVHNFVNSSF